MARNARAAPNSRMCRSQIGSSWPRKRGSGALSRLSSVDVDTRAARMFHVKQRAGSLLERISHAAARAARRHIKRRQRRRGDAGDARGLIQRFRPRTQLSRSTISFDRPGTAAKSKSRGNPHARVALDELPIRAAAARHRARTSASARPFVRFSRQSGDRAQLEMALDLRPPPLRHATGSKRRCRQAGWSRCRPAATDDTRRARSSFDKVRSRPAASGRRPSRRCSWCAGRTAPRLEPERRAPQH